MSNVPMRVLRMFDVVVDGELELACPYTECVDPFAPNFDYSIGVLVDAAEQHILEYHSNGS